MKRTKTTRKPKAVAAPVNVERILRESDERVAEMNRESVRTHVAMMRQFAETIVEEPIRWQAGAPGFETPWLPADVAPFVSNARAVLSHASVVERRLADPGPNALADAAIPYASCCSEYERMMRIFEQRDLDEGRRVPARRRKGAVATRDKAERMRVGLRAILDAIPANERGNHKSDAAQVAQLWNAAHPNDRPITPRAVEDRLFRAARRKP